MFTISVYNIEDNEIARVNKEKHYICISGSKGNKMIEIPITLLPFDPDIKICSPCGMPVARVAYTASHTSFFFYQHYIYSNLHYHNVYGLLIS
jgi:hypothetical protein